MKNYSYLACCVLAASLQSMPSSANDNDCQDNKNDCEKAAITLDKVTVTATRTEVDVSKYAGSISVLEAEELAPTSNIVDGLSSIPGVETGGDTGRTIGSQYTVRGFGYQSESRVIIKQNGVPQSPSLFSNHISSFRTDTDILKRVEVVKGASSILYGSGAIGGIINMQTMNAKDFLAADQTFGGLAGIRYESNKMHSVRGAIFGKITDVPLDFALYSKKAKYGDIDLADGGTEDHQTIDNDETIKTVFFTLGSDISKEQRLEMSIFDFDEALDTTWQTLYHYDVDEESPVVGSLQQTDFVIDYTFKDSSNALIDLSAKAFYSTAYYSRGWDDYDEETEERDTLTYKNEETRTGFNIKNVSKFSTGEFNHTFLVGVDYNKREEGGIYNRNNEISDFGSMPNTYDDWGVYIQNIINIDRLEFSLGGRFDQFERSVNKPGKTDYDDNNFAPRIGLTYEITKGFNVLLSWAETFRAPTPHETSSEGALNPHYYYLPNPELGAETARETEGGFSYVSNSVFTDMDQVSIKATYFDGEIEDMISLKKLPDLGEPPESAFYAQYQNVSEARRKGYEVTASYLLDSIRFDSSYEHLDIYDEETDEKVMQGFADKLHLSVAYFNHALGLQLGLGVNHWYEPDQNPKTIVSRGVTYTYVDQDFTQANFKGVWDINMQDINFINNAKVNFGVNNLTDKKYINARNTNTTSRVGTGRNIFIDIEVGF